MTLTWQKMSSPPSNGLMKPKPRGFQRQASPFLRAPASPPPPPPRPRLRLREPPPPRERLRERLCLEGLSAPLDANYWDKCSGASRKHGICSLGRRITFAICSSASSINNSPAFNTSHHFNHYSRLYITSFQPSFTTTSHHFNHLSRLQIETTSAAGTTHRYFTITVGAYVRVRRATTWTPHGRRGWAAWAIGSLIPA